MNRTLTIFGLIAVIVAICGLLATIVLKGGVEVANGPTVTALIGFVATLVGLLVAILKIDDLQSKVNGHLQKHADDVERLKATVLKDQKPADPPS